MTDVLWPGAIIDAATIPTGDYVPIVAPRKPLTISVSLINIAGAKSRTVQDPKLSTMRESIASILAQEVTGATERASLSRSTQSTRKANSTSRSA